MSGVQTRAQRLDSWAAERIAHRQLDSLSAAGDRPRASSMSSVLLVVLSLIPNLLMWVTGAGGLWLLVLGSTWPLRVIGVGLIAVAAATRPRLGKADKRSVELSRRDAPAMWSLIDRVASAVGTRAPHRLIIVPEFNAYVVTLRAGRRLLAVGAPLWVALDAQTRVALLGHELGHLAHRDLRRGRLVAGARATLTFWYLALMENVPTVGDIPMPLRIVTFPLRWALTAYATVLLYLGAIVGRRQEHLADLAARRAAGRSGLVRLLEVLAAEPAFDVVYNRVSIDPQRPDPIIAVRERAHRFFAEDRSGYRLLAEKEELRVDDSHPATHVRIKLAEAQEPNTPLVLLADSESSRLDEELDTVLHKSVSDYCARYRYVR